MNKSLLLLLSCIVMQCTSPNKASKSDFYFDAVNLDNLNLDSLPSFWNGCSLYVSPMHPGNYCGYSGHIDSRTCYTSEGLKRLGVAVFINPTLAIEAVEASIKRDTSMNGSGLVKAIRRGDSANSKTWWISEQSDNRFSIIYLKFNTVIGAAQNAPSIEFAQDSMLHAIEEVENRIQLFAHSPPPAFQDKYFNITDLENLNISNIAPFWQGDSLHRQDDTSRYEGFLHSISYAVIPKSSDIGKFISVSVYTTTDQAVLSIYKKRTGSQAVTCYGDPEGLIKGVWFYTCDPVTPYVGITFQKWNTIVDITYYPHNYEIITNTVKEIAGRIDELSN